MCRSHECTAGSLAVQWQESHILASLERAHRGVLGTAGGAEWGTADGAEWGTADGTDLVLQNSGRLPNRLTNCLFELLVLGSHLMIQQYKEHLVPCRPLVQAALGKLQVHEEQKRQQGQQEQQEQQE